LGATGVKPRFRASLPHPISATLTLQAAVARRTHEGYSTRPGVGMYQALTCLAPPRHALPGQAVPHLALPRLAGLGYVTPGCKVPRPAWWKRN